MKQVLKLAALIAGISVLVWGLRHLIRLVLAKAEVGGPAFVMINPPAENEAMVPVPGETDQRLPDISAESA